MIDVLCLNEDTKRQCICLQVRIEVVHKTCLWNNRILDLEAASEMESGSLCDRGGPAVSGKRDSPKVQWQVCIEIEPEPCLSLFFDIQYYVIFRYTA